MASTSLLEEIRKLQPKVSSGQESDQREFTGERFLPGYADGSIELQHIHRYASALPLIVGRAVLDIACGEGYGSDLMAQVASKVIGVDIDNAVIDLARERYRRPNLSFRTGSATAIPIGDDSVDVVVSFETLEHVADQDAFWSEIKRVMRADGVLVVSSPNRDTYNEQRTNDNPFHVHELSQEELVGELSKRFLHHQLLSQSIVFGSLLEPSLRETTAETVISVDLSTSALNWQMGNEIRHPYSLAVASDLPAPLMERSLYTGPYPPNAMASLVGGIAERDQLVRDLRNQLAGLETSSATLIAAAQQERDEVIMTARRAEENLLDQAKNLTIQRDRALLQSERIRETLVEQDKTIHALKALVEECTQRLVTADACRIERRSSGNEH